MTLDQEKAREKAQAAVRDAIACEAVAVHNEDIAQRTRQKAENAKLLAERAIDELVESFSAPALSAR